MTTPIAGKVSKLEVSSDAGTTWIPVLGRVDMGLNLNKSEIDASHMDADDWASYLQGRKDGTIDFSLRYIEDDEGQAALIENYFASKDTETDLDIRFRLQELTGANEFTGKAFVNSLTITAADEAPSDMNGSLRINGKVTKAKQASAGA